MAEQAAQDWTVLKLLNWTKDYLDKVNLENPRLCAEMLLAFTLHCQRIELYTRFDYRPTEDELKAFRELVQRARAFEPVAYLVGQKEFYSLRFKVTPDVLVPRAETELLAREAITHLQKYAPQGRAWDACTGSGCVGIATAHEAPGATVLATDISPEAVAIAQENAQINKVQDRVRVRVADLLSLPPDCADLAPFDVITANPPYIAKNQMITEVVQREPPVAIWGGDEGMDFIRPIIQAAPGVLKEGGVLVMEYGYGMADAVRDLVVATGAFDEPKIFSDHQGIERAFLARRK
jgi:release factor glutamine methyltransferase